MRARIALIYFLVVSVSLLNAQKNTELKSGSKLRPAQLQMVHDTDHDTCLGKKFSLVYYFIQDSSYTKTTANTATLAAATTTFLNSLFARICVQFENCSTVIIPVYPYNEWTSSIVEPAVIKGWYAPNTINVYLPEFVDQTYAMEKAGYAHAPNTFGAIPDSLDVVVIGKDAFANNAAGVTRSTIAHVFGHYFGLSDTFGESGPAASPGPPNGIVSHEYVRRTNCSTNGDGICDTDADCYPVHYYPPPVQPPKTHCYFYPPIQDGKGDYYTPPLDNFMSMWACRCRFTQQQYNRMAKFILKHRMNLH